MWINTPLSIVTVVAYHISLPNVTGHSMTMHLTENRPLKLRFLFTHFTPFEDMNHPQSRAQRMGLQHTDRFLDRNNLTVWPKVTVSLTNLFRTYIEAGLTSESNSTIAPLTWHTLMKSAFKVSGSPKQYFLGRLIEDEKALLNDDRLLDAQKEFYKNFRNEQLQPEGSKMLEPFFMYAMRGWKLFYLVAVASFRGLYTTSQNLPPSVDPTYLTPSDIHDKWSLIFIDELCQMTRENYSNVMQIPNGFCPDPCSTEPCVSIPYTSSAKCTPLGTKWYEFSCNCQPNFKWIQPPRSIGHCQSDDDCSAYCNPVGTRRCDVIQNKQFCVCRPTHMGPRCNKKRDPCLELSNQAEVPGNISCNAAQGGKCIGILGTNTYSCICPASYTSDPSYMFPNCLALKDRCLEIICVQGDCISSKDGQETHCICPDEAYGQHCEFTRGKWAQWSPWSECSPNCGVSEYRRRVRTRDCLGEACRGGEGHLQMEMCVTMPCPDEILALARQGRSEEIGELNIQMLQAQVARYVKLVGAVAEALILISCVFAAVTATAMAATVHLM
ncbi:hypothetical protein P879_01767 [Paragonimus westermani]|uniref:EGF-like domain-containing protein n=1 Tax=Paragonimus westermani TaxID=34504 RepID=A0A8T0DGE6_9TREM|nr:hypothetical protein P879_01767 [Paragonimus westermani]